MGTNLTEKPELLVGLTLTHLARSTVAVRPPSIPRLPYTPHRAETRIVQPGREVSELEELCDVLTVEIEHVNCDILASLEDRGVRVQPSSRTISVVQDKYAQKCHFKQVKNGLRTLATAYVANLSCIAAAESVSALVTSQSVRPCFSPALPCRSRGSMMCPCLGIWILPQRHPYGKRG